VRACGCESERATGKEEDPEEEESTGIPTRPRLVNFERYSWKEVEKRVLRLGERERGTSGCGPKDQLPSHGSRRLN
jgi:hypothetical protein